MEVNSFYNTSCLLEKSDCAMNLKALQKKKVLCHPFVIPLFVNKKVNVGSRITSNSVIF